MERAKNTSLTDNASSSMINAWYLEHEKGIFGVTDIPENHHQAFTALVFNYRPPSEIWEMDDSERLVLIGHGKGGSPEIHSRGNGFLLSAGGFQRGEASQIVARPIVLLLNDTADDLSECFYISGKGRWQKWNNTGVHHRFAVGRSAVHVPDQYQAVDSVGNWKLFRPSSEVSVITYSTVDFGIIHLSEKDVELRKLAALNPEPASGSFYPSEGKTVDFDVRTPKGKWLIKSVDGVEVNRKTDGWPRVRIQ